MEEEQAITGLCEAFGVSCSGYYRWREALPQWWSVRHLLARIEGAGGTMLKLRVAEKIAAIKLDNDLAGEGSEAGAAGTIPELFKELRK